MNILIYSKQEDSDERRLMKNIDFTRIHLCRSIADLKNYLNIASGEMRRIVILIINNHDEMVNICKLLILYNDLLLIVVINQNCFTTYDNVHKLRPRYITYKDSDFFDVAIVLNRMINHYYL